jgi:hypothetical protein
MRHKLGIKFQIMLTDPFLADAVHLRGTQVLNIYFQRSISFEKHTHHKHRPYLTRSGAVATLSFCLLV